MTLESPIPGRRSFGARASGWATQAIWLLLFCVCVRSLSLPSQQRKNRATAEGSATRIKSSEFLYEHALHREPLGALGDDTSDCAQKAAQALRDESRTSHGKLPQARLYCVALRFASSQTLWLSVTGLSTIDRFGSSRYVGPDAKAHLPREIYDVAHRVALGPHGHALPRSEKSLLFATELSSSVLVGSIPISQARPDNGPLYLALLFILLLIIWHIPSAPLPVPQGAVTAVAIAALWGWHLHTTNAPVDRAVWICALFFWLLPIAALILRSTPAGKRIEREVASTRLAYTFLAPAALAMVVLVGIPFIYGLSLGFYDQTSSSGGHFVGLSHFKNILSGDGRALSDPLNFWFTCGVTLLWTFTSVTLHVTIGVGLALLLSRPALRLRPAYRVLLILPWAVPNYITALLWSGLFQLQFGAINQLLRLLGLGAPNWFAHFSTSFAANVVTNTWMGFPFMMVVALSALTTIPRDLYEAAELDGASAWQRFRTITWPHLAPSLWPSVVLGSIWTFNMFNVIYLVSGGRPGGRTDILVTEAFRWAFEQGKTGYAAAYATLILLVLAALTWLLGRIGRRIGAQ